jgi:hypothetical protein
MDHVVAGIIETSERSKGLVILVIDRGRSTIGLATVESRRSCIYNRLLTRYLFVCRIADERNPMG